MLQGQIPHREGLKLGIPGSDSAFVLLIQLTQAYRHLTATGTRSCYHHQRTLGLYIVVAAKSLVGVDERDIIRITVYRIVYPCADSDSSETLAIEGSALLSVVMGDDDTRYPEVPTEELLSQSQHVLIVGDT